MDKYWWAGVLVFLLFIGLNVAVYFLRNKPELSYLIAYIAAIYLLIYKTGEYTYWQIVGQHIKIPLEFSTLSYFFVGIFFTFKVKKLEAFASFTGLLAGFIFSLGFWISPTSFLVTNYEGAFLFIMAMINHHLLYFVSALMTINVRRFEKKDTWIQVVGIAVMVAYSWLIYSVTNYKDAVGKPIIIQITDGSILQNIGITLKPWLLVIYILLAVAVVGGLLYGFYYLNNYCSNKRESLNNELLPSS